MAESASFDWDAVPDMTLDGRSIVPYPDPDPEGTAKMWDKWRADREERTAAPVSADDDEDAAIEVYKNNHPPLITQSAEEFDEPCSALGSFVKLAHAHDWDIVELAHSRAAARGKVIKSGERAGESNPDWDIETQWLKVEKGGVGRGVVGYTLINGKTYKVYRSFNGLAGRSDAEMKSILKGEE
jgi:hypothetical protein